MIFVDTNVFMYAVGRPHPLQAHAREFFAEANRRSTPLGTSAEVLQELAHAYLHVGRLRTLDAAMALVVGARVEVWPLEEADVTLARQLHEKVSHAGGQRSLPSCKLQTARGARDYDLRSGSWRRHPEAGKEARISGNPEADIPSGRWPRDQESGRYCLMRESSSSSSTLPSRVSSRFPRE